MGNRYRKKHETIEAVQWKGNNFNDFMIFNDTSNDIRVEVSLGKLAVSTPIRNVIASVGDWIIKDVLGIFYVYKSNVFDDMYERVSDTKVESD